MNDQNNMSELFKPQDLSKTFEHAMHVFQGRHEALPDLLKDAGTILTRVSKKFTPKQLILTVAGLAVAAIVAVTVIEQRDHGNHQNDDSNKID